MAVNHIVPVTFQRYLYNMQTVMQKYYPYLFYWVHCQGVAKGNDC